MDAQQLLVRSMAWEAHSVLSLELSDPDGRPLPSWHAGTHIDLVIDGIGIAQYSLCGPLHSPTWRIGVLHQPDGRGVSHHIHTRLRPGEMVRIGATRNHFPLEPADSYLFIAGGIGITPLLPMIEEAEALGSNWQLIYGGRSRASMAFISELAHRNHSVRLFPADEFGLLPVDELLRSNPSASVYCCGPEPLLQAVQAACTRIGRAPPRVERFGKAPATLVQEHSFSIVLSRSGMTLEVPLDRSIADVLDEHGIFVPTSCREGVCGSCETRVLAGAIDHRDSILSEEERLRGDTMMVCVSRAAGSSLTLDL